jgi:CheY-like chemotaxis protein
LHAHLNLLLCDDDPDDCFFFKEALETLGRPANLIAVHNGEQLMNHLRQADKLPDVLFLDLNMPRKNGFECLREIRLNRKLEHLPVIILSTSFDQEVVNLLHKSGATYFIRKAAEFSQIKAMILQALLLTNVKNNPQTSIEDFVLKAASN